MAPHLAPRETGWTYCAIQAVALTRPLAALIHFAGAGRLAARAVVVLAHFRGAAEAFVVDPAR